MTIVLQVIAVTPASELTEPVDAVTRSLSCELSIRLKLQKRECHLPHAARCQIAG